VATDAGGRVLSRQDFTPWGELRSGGVGQTARDGTGQRRDGTGLLCYNARYDDPKLGRFLSADTAGTHLDRPQSLNRYRYVRNNPLIYTDPTGHDAIAPSSGGGETTAESCARRLDCSVDTINQMSWDERIAFVRSMDRRDGLGGWCNHGVGLRAYSRDAVLFGDSERMKLAAASSLAVIRRGLRGSRDQRGVGGDAAGAWTTFFGDYYSAGVPDAERRRSWGVAEQQGVDQAQALASGRGIYFTTVAQAAA